MDFRLDRRLVHGLAFLAGLLAGGMPYWLLPYRQAEPPGALVGSGAVAIAVIVVVLVMLRLATPRHALTIMVGCLPVAIALRVLVETWRDRTTHNLWPFELVMGGLVGLAIVLPAILLGVMLRWVIEGDSGRR